MANLDLYERYAQPPENALKSFSNGKFSGTDINPMWRIKALTEAFGPCGIGWYTEVIRQWREDTDDSSATVYCHIHLYIKVDGEWSKPITGIGGNTLSRKTKSGSSTTDEAYKMAYTDAMGIACKALGIGADIWWKEARSKYTANDVSGSQPTTGTANDVSGGRPPVNQPTEQECVVCCACRNPITDYYYDNNTKYYCASKIIGRAKEKFGNPLCYTCLQKAIIDDTPHTEYDERALQEYIA